MKSRSKTLSKKIWLYLIIFSVLILGFLWFFQIIFLNKYYELTRIHQLDQTADKIISNYKQNNFEQLFTNISFEKNVCIEAYKNGENIYGTAIFNRTCMTNKQLNPLSDQYKTQFQMSNLTKQKYIIKNNHDDKTILYGIKLNKKTYVYISSSLMPLNTTVSILSGQLVIVTILVLILSFIVAYFISKSISKPIVGMTNSAQKMAQGNYNVVFKTDTEIQEIKQLAESLDFARDTLSQTEELRREFMANVSHDLKTPLTMIKAYAEMVRDITYKDQKKRESNLNTIISETDRLNSLVNDILELSKLNSDVDSMKLETFDLDNLIKEVLEFYNILNQNENYKFIYHSKKVIVNADKRRIEQVLHNLITNAINHTGENKTISIKVTHNDGRAKIEIKDSGKGISKENLKHIWDRYYKIDRSYQRALKGTGLGLSIVKNILEKHKSNFGVKSYINRGTTFYFDLEEKK